MRKCHICLLLIVLFTFNSFAGYQHLDSSRWRQLDERRKLGCATLPTVIW